jgi:hypothetical protein
MDVVSLIGLAILVWFGGLIPQTRLKHRALNMIHRASKFARLLGRILIQVKREVL